ncbi:MAG TPA: hypothetical protein DEB06_08760 [Phycisphaerales bacterium]|nr:hypothetical protein [Phycisphaerales bacterium]
MGADEPGRDQPPPANHAGASRWVTGLRGGATLVLLCLLAHWPGVFSIPPVDRDESRFAQASRQMLESGTLRGWVVPMVGDRPRLNKPPLIYWLQASAAALFGDPHPLPLGEGRGEGHAVRGPIAGDARGSEAPESLPLAPSQGKGELKAGRTWVYRVPSLLCALASVLLTWRLGLSLFSFLGSRAPMVAWAGAAMLGACVMVLWDARQARADQLLLATTTLSMLGLWKCASGAPRRWWLVLWVGVGLGVLSKGPITPMVIALTALALGVMRRREHGLWWWLRATRPLTGALIILALVVPWVVLVGSAVGWSEYASEVWRETIGRSVSAKEGHWGPPGYHLVLLPVLLWPGSLLTAAGLGLAWRTARGGAGTASGTLAARFLLSWIAPSWLVFEAVSTKLPHYTMPLLPALALVSAWALSEGVARGAAASGLLRTGPRLGFVVWGVIGLAIVVGFPVVLWRAIGLDLAPGTLMVLGAAIGASGGMVLAALRGLWQGRFVMAQALGLGAMILSSAVTLGVALPRAPALWISPAIVRVVDRLPDAPSRPVGAVGFQEDSLQFLLRGRLERVGKARLDEWRAENPRGVLVLPMTLVPEPQRDSVMGRVTGFNYSTGARVDLGVLAPGDPSPSR